MKENASIVLYRKEIEDILFDYYFKECGIDSKKRDETIEVNYNIESKTGVLKTTTKIEFEFNYKQTIESLTINRKLTVTLQDLCDIINEKISNEGYEIDNVTDNLIYGFEDDAKPNLNFLTFNLKKKEKVKTKMKGMKKNV